MRNRISGFGMVILMVVAAVVLYLVSRDVESKKDVLSRLKAPPPAVGLTTDDSPSAGTRPEGAPQSPRPTNLDQMRGNTDAHRNDVQRAMDQSQ